MQDSTSYDEESNELGVRALIEYIARSLVDEPDDVEVIEIAGEQTSVIELKVCKDDLGKVIGKQGRTARAMRTILTAASTKVRKRSVLEIIE
ncbi:MAG TPA: KH domain-containing protein [Myxococcales bacterium]|nr:KH domain-containing protein [Myxococcales bacterium]HIN86388.1 KH domain-containing protein [Myxococcales bacterium]